MPGDIRTISEDPEHYSKIYKIMERQMSPIKSWTDEIFQKRILDEVNVQDRDLKFLGVGSGSGEAELKYTVQLAKRFPDISHTVIEPAKDYVDGYKQLVVKEASKVQGVTYDWRQQTLDQYRQEVGASKKYDIITAVNCVYYFDDVEDSLIYLHDILEDGGILMMVVASENGLSYKIWNRFPKFYRDLPFHQVCSLNLIDILKKRKINYETDHMGHDVNITECFNQSSQEGQYLIDFMSHVVNLRDSVSIQFYSEFMKFIKESSRKECTLDGTNIWLFGTENEVIFFKK